MTRIRAALAALATAVVLGACLAAAPAIGAPAGATIVGGASQRCLDVTGNTQTPGAAANIYDCNGQANQFWTLTTAGELRVFNGARCLDVKGASIAAGTPVVSWTCNGGANQKWTLQRNGTITGVQSGLCLDVKGASRANSALVQIYTCNGGGNQQWKTSLSASDTSAPSVPQNPRVTSVVCDSATFAWNASSDDVGVAYYDVYHDGQLVKSVSGSTLSTSITVVPGVTWGLYVNARDAAGNVSQASTTVPVTPPQCQSDTAPPSTPTGLAASVSGTSVTLTWNASTDNVGVRAYDVLRGGTRVGGTTGTASQAPETRFVDSGLAGTTTYSYAVVARDAQQNRSSASTSVSATTGSACASAVCGTEQVGHDSDIPWGLVTLPDGTILYTRRDAHEIARLDPASGTSTTVGAVPNVESTDGEGGLTGLAISPTFASDAWLYIMHTSPTDNRIVRIKYSGGALQASTEQVLLTGILRNKFHDGGRLRFGPDGKLYASTGDAQNGDNAQNLSSLNGKVLRLNPDGSVPADNPYGNYVWSYGHRNPQGLAFDAQGRLWEQEFGNSVMDETNLIVKGGNYGWPACEGTTGSCAAPGYIAPKQTYPTADGSCSGIAIVRSALFVACERGQRLYRSVISGDSLTNQQTYFNGTFGRLRTVEPAPDGGLWLTTSNLGDKDSTPNNSDEKILHVTLGSG